jgi:4-hydroxy-tetrahydrodipicolinate reductase
MNCAPPPRTTRVVLIGASGRMGRALLAAAPAYPTLALVGALASKDSAALGRDSGATAGGAVNHVMLTSELGPLLPRADVVIDFSSAAATRAHLRACVAAGKALLVGTTGYEAALESEFAAAARAIPLLIAANTSLGVTLMLELARAAARALPQFVAEVSETHHKDKRDAPSGTALALAAALRVPGAAAREIPIRSLREAEVVGEHTVTLQGPEELLSLTHRALDRRVFATGALAAALWLAPQPPGRYAMRDVLGVKTWT